MLKFFSTKEMINSEQHVTYKKQQNKHMKRLLIIIALAFSINSVSSQKMDNASLDEIFKTMSDTIQGESGR